MRSVLGVHWKDWCWSWNSNTLATWCEELAHWKRPSCWERLRAGGEGTTEDEMVGGHYQLDGRGFEWTPGVGDGQGGLACCDSWGHKESDTTELNWTVYHLKKQRHHFADQGLYSQSYVFSNSHVQMWESDQKKGWVPKNWHFWTAVLEKPLESPLDCKEITPDNPQGN